MAPAGRGRGYLRLSVARDRRGDARRRGRPATVGSEVANFYPLIAGWGWFSRIGRCIYRQTQLRIHVIVTHAFLRSLREPRARARRAVGRAQPSRSPVISRSFARSWRAVIVRTVPERERIEIDSVVAPVGP